MRTFKIYTLINFQIKTPFPRWIVLCLYLKNQSIKHIEIFLDSLMFCWVINIPILLFIVQSWILELYSKSCNFVLLFKNYLGNPKSFASIQILKSVCKLPGILIGIELNVQTNLGRTDILKLNLPIHEDNISFHSFKS